jgi:hypothetical protein
MLPTETANLPKNERLRLHSDFVANEQAYLRMRDALLATHRGQWVAVAGDGVVAAGSQLLRRHGSGRRSGGSPIHRPSRR